MSAKTETAPTEETIVEDVAGDASAEEQAAMEKNGLESNFEDQMIKDAPEEEIFSTIENYFSKQKFLQDHMGMNADGFMPISKLLSAEDLRNLTSSVDLVARVMEQSSVVTLDETKSMLKPAFKLQRNTIILRDVSSETDPKDIEALFKQEGAPSVVSGENIRPDIGDTWFISLESEDLALETITWLRAQKLNDKPIRARMKSENMQRSYYYANPVTANPQVDPGYYQNQSQQMGYVDNQGYMGYGGYNGNNYQNQDGYGRHDKEHKRGNYRNKGNRRGGGPGGPNNNEGRKPKGGNGAGRGGTKPRRSDSRSNSVVPLGLAHFPPLPSTKPEDEQSGYTAEFQSYDRNELIDIFQKTSITKPELPAEELFPITVEANLEMDVEKREIVVEPVVAEEGSEATDAEKKRRRRKFRANESRGNQGRNKTRGEREGERMRHAQVAKRNTQKKHKK